MQMAANPPATAAPKRPGWQAPRGLGGRVLLYALLVGCSVAFLLPFAWMVTTSLKDNANVFVFPPQWLPDPVVWSNYVAAWTYQPFNLFLRNTIVVTAVALVGEVFSSALVAYGFARLRFPGRDALFVLVLATMMLPGQVTLVPTYVLFSRLGWIDTFLPLTVPAYFGNAFYIFLLRQYFRTIPPELDEAAEIDGATKLGIFWRIILPLSWPALAAVAIFSFMFHWDDFFRPLIFLLSPEKFTLALGLKGFVDQYGMFPPNLLMAASILVALPMVVVFFLAQKYFIRGIVLQVNKG